MATANGYQSYKTANVNTSDQGRLIIICYDVAIRNCTQAIEDFKNNEIEARSKKIYKAQDAISELMIALDQDAGGEFSKRLFSLYEYMTWRLTQACVKSSPVMVKEVVDYLKDLRSSWLVAIENVRKEQPPEFLAQQKKGQELRESVKLVG